MASGHVRSRDIGGGLNSLGGAKTGDVGVSGVVSGIGDLVGRAADWVGDMFRRDVLCIISEQHNIREQH